MKKYVLSLILLTLPFLPTFAITKIFLSCLPKDGNETNLPIGRSTAHLPIIGIEGHTLLRLEKETVEIYQVEILHQGKIVYSFIWDFQQSEIVLPSNLQGEYDIQIVFNSDKFTGTFNIE